MLFYHHNTLMLLFDTLGRLGLVYQIVFLPSDKMISGLNQWFVSINGWSDKLIERAVYILAHKFFVQIGQVHFSRLALRLPWPARSDTNFSNHWAIDPYMYFLQTSTYNTTLLHPSLLFAGLTLPIFSSKVSRNRRNGKIPWKYFSKGF